MYGDDTYNTSLNEFMYVIHVAQTVKSINVYGNSNVKSL